MKDKKEISIGTLILRGWLTVFIPVSIVILGVWNVLWTVFNLNYTISVFIGALVGWYFWAYLTKKWVRWATDRNVSETKLLKAGRLGLLLWKHQTIKDALHNE